MVISICPEALIYARRDTPRPLHDLFPALQPRRQQPLISSPTGSEITCLWYGSFRSRTVRVILVRDDKPRTRGRDDRGYGLPLVTTDLESSAEDLVARYAARWGIEQAFADARQILGVGDARNRTRRAVERTVPFGLICFSVVTVWYALHGARPRGRDRSPVAGSVVHHEDRAVL